MTALPEKNARDTDPPMKEGLFDAQLELPLAAEQTAAPEPFVSVRKRDGREEPFERGKIAKAIGKATEYAGAPHRELAEHLAAAVTLYLTKALGASPPTVEQIDDAVERVLIQMDHGAVALAYARHRDRLARIRRLRTGDLRPLLGELEEARIERETLAGHGASALFVRTSADTIATWDRKRIEDALLRETGIDAGMAQLIALEVEQQIGRARIGTLTASLIREMVGAKLVEHGLEAHRQRHMRLGLPLYDTGRVVRGITAHGPARSPDATDRALARFVKKEYALHQVFSPKVTEAHLRGDIHLHDLDRVDRLHDATLSPAYIARHGLGIPGSDDFAAPARNAAQLLAQLVKASAVLQQHFARPIAWDAVNVHFAPYLEQFTSEEIEQFARLFLYEFSFDALTGGAACPATVKIHWNIPDRLRALEAAGPGGLRTGKPYGAYQHAAEQFAWALTEVLRTGAAQGASFPSPFPHIVLDAAFFKAPGHERFLLHAARLASERKPLRFIFDRGGNPGAATHPEAAPRITLQCTGLNLARAAFAAASDAAFQQDLESIFAAAIAAHEEKRQFMEELYALPGGGPLSLLAREREGRAWAPIEEAAWLVSVEGLFAAAAHRSGNPAHSAESGAEAARILERLRALADVAGVRAGCTVLLAQRMDGQARTRFATLDARAHPESAPPHLEADPDSQALAYPPGALLPRGHPLNPMDQARLEGDLHAYIGHGAMTRIPLSGDIVAAESIADFLRKAFRGSGARALSFVPPNDE